MKPEPPHTASVTGSSPRSVGLSKSGRDVVDHFTRANGRYHAPRPARQAMYLCRDCSCRPAMNFMIAA